MRVWQRPSALRPEFASVPWDLYERTKIVTLAANVMFMNGLPFLVTLSRNTKKGSVEFLPSRTVKQLCNSLQKVLLIYRCDSFLERTCLMDMEFEKLKDAMQSSIINIITTREHVWDFEQYIQVVKERGRSISSQLPYKKFMADQIVLHLIKFVVMWINALSDPSSVSSTMNPGELVLCVKMDFKKHCRVRFGAHIEASIDDVITNMLRDRMEE